MYRLKNVAPVLLYPLAILIVGSAFLFTFTYQEKHVSADFCSSVSPASVCPPSGTGFLCICSGMVGFGDPSCSMGCLAVPAFTCADVGMTGSPWPTGCVAIPTCSASMGNSCSSSGSNSCGMYGSGTVQCDGSCSASVPSNSLCPTAPPTPTCADYGQLGTYPSCYAPPTPTCADYGQLGTYPSCYSAPPTCTPDATCGGTRANTCSSTSCTDSCGTSYPGQKTTGSCAAVTTCADLGKVGIYPFCTDPVPPPTSCTSPTVTITAAPSRIASGGTSTLTVSGTGINTSCTVTSQSGATIGTVSASSCNANSSSIVTPAMTSQTTYTVSCDSGAATAKVIVNVNPTFTPF